MRPRRLVPLGIVLGCWNCGCYGSTHGEEQHDEGDAKNGPSKQEQGSCDSGSTQDDDERGRYDPQRRVDDDVATNEERTIGTAAAEEELNEHPCSLFMAPSGLEGAGFGMYAAGAPRDGDVLSSSPSIFFLFNGNPHMERLLLKDYVWGAEQYPGATYETALTANDDVSATTGASLYSPGLGALTNSHPARSNLVKVVPPSIVVAPLLDRRHDPGAGAFADYVASYVYKEEEDGDDPARADDPYQDAAQELFIHYGDAWFDERSDFRNVPRKDDHHEADRVVARFAATRSAPLATVTADTVADFLRFVSDHIDERSKPRAARLLRKIATTDELRRVLLRNGTARASIATPTAPSRSREWLERHGHCQNHLRLDVSTIRQAGRGAFATRLLPKGSVIVSSPLLPIFNQGVLQTDVPLRVCGDVAKQGLLTNYVIGHPNCSAVFLPTTLLAAVNHASARQQHDGAATNMLMPNAALRWSTRSRPSQFYVRRPLEDLRQERSTALVVDLVALSDIRSGEEVFIDYGPEWEAHWEEHVRHWKSPCNEDDGRPCFSSSKAVADMNSDKFNRHYHAWSKDHFALCSLLGETDAEQIETLAVFPYPFTSDLGVETPLRIVSPSDGLFELAAATSQTRSSMPCDIVRFDESQGTFDVLLFSAEQADDSAVRLLQRHRSLPSARLSFHTKPFRSDMFWPGAFRHMIHFPDEIFPDVWKDRHAG